jgi:uncharacterized protein YdiU (UPF0061 family)
LFVCSLITSFGLDFVPNGSDSSARYTYQRQAEVCRWNLMTFAEALLPLLPAEAAQLALEEYDGVYKSKYLALMRGKLGLLTEKTGTVSESVS